MLSHHSRGQRPQTARCRGGEVEGYRVYRGRPNTLTQSHQFVCPPLTNLLTAGMRLNHRHVMNNELASLFFERETRDDPCLEKSRVGLALLKMSSSQFPARIHLHWSEHFNKHSAVIEWGDEGRGSGRGWRVRGGSAHLYARLLTWTANRGF